VPLTFNIGFDEKSKTSRELNGYVIKEKRAEIK
jgi:hypothetical protein